MMDEAAAVRVERWIDRGAAALFAASCAFAAHSLAGAAAGWPVLAPAAGGGAAGFVLALGLLSRVKPGARRVPPPIFDVREIAFDQEVLLLTERHQPEAEAADDALLLEDALAAPDPDSRVVRLFDPAAMPTAGELNRRIERHLGDRCSSSSMPQPPDASQELHDALDELRRSLR